MFLNKLSSPVLTSIDFLTPSFHLELIVDLLLKEDISFLSISYLVHYRYIDFYFIQWIVIPAQIIPEVVSGSPLRLALVSF